MANKIQHRRDTAANWTSANPVLAAGEPALETDTGKTKLGDGVTGWSALPYKLDKAGADATYASAKAELKRRHIPNSLIWNPAVTTDAPALATSGPGGPPPQTGGWSNTFHAYNDPVVTFLGGMPVLAVALGTNYYQNNANGQTGSGASSWAWEFDYYGADLALYFRNAISAGSYFWVWVNGQPATAAPVASTASAANNAYWYRLTWAAAAQRRVRIYVAGADYGGVAVQPTDSISATGKPNYSILVLGDSYTDGTGATNQLTSYPVTLGRMLDVELFQCGIGGTGYVQPGSGVPYGDATRINPIGTLRPDEVWFVGSINDSTYTSTQVSTNAVAAWNAVKAASPNSIIRVCGVQANSGSMSAANIANNNALKAAAQAAGYSWFDPIGEGWITGSGHVGATAGNGNADIMVWTDGVHPSQAGHDYMARRLKSDYIKAIA